MHYFLHVTENGLHRRPFEEFDTDSQSELIGDQSQYGDVELVQHCFETVDAALLCDEICSNMNWDVVATIRGWEFRGAIAIVGIERDFCGLDIGYRGLSADVCDIVEKQILLPGAPKKVRSVYGARTQKKKPAASPTPIQSQVEPQLAVQRAPAIPVDRVCLDELDDEALMARVAKGDNEAYGWVDKTYRRRVLAFIDGEIKLAKSNGRLKETVDAQDITQTVLLSLHKSAKSFRKGTKVLDVLRRRASNILEQKFLPADQRDPGDINSAD
jgi:hypothetical protein